MDREKILEDFEYVVRKSHGEGWDYVDGLTTEDGFKILQLLKEQEAVEPVSDPYVYWLCGACGKKIDYRHKYCPWCGKQVKWK
jgi:hypothetical protein